MPGRDNGFVARHYVPLADLDPRLADAMLDVLRAESIAAYVVPSTGRVGGYLDVHLPERPRDRLWVDREHHDRAVVLLSAHGDPADHGELIEPRDSDGSGQDGAPAPGAAPPPPVAGTDSGEAHDTSEEEWARLVASFELPSYDEVPRWPVAEDIDTTMDAGWPASGIDAGSHQQAPPLADLEPDPGSPVPRRIIRPADRADDAPVVPAIESPYSEYDPLSVLDEHFVPPTPPPVPRLRVATRWALLSIVVGVALIVGKSFSDWFPDAVAFGVVAIVGGFVGLVALMREDRPSDSDPDDGAVV